MGVLTMSDRWNPSRKEVMESLSKVWNAFDYMEHELYAVYVFNASKMLMESASIEEFKAWIGEIMLNTDDAPIEPSKIIRRIDEGGLKRFIEDRSVDDDL